MPNRGSKKGAKPKQGAKSKKKAEDVSARALDREAKVVEVEEQEEKEEFARENP
jgi:hypothetical protein